MATLRELIIKISANSQSFQTEISRASRMGADYYKTMQNGGRQAAAASRETQRALSEVTSQLNSTKSAALGMAGAFAGAFATSELINYADKWSQLSGRLKLASTSSDDFSSAQKTLFEISQRTGTSLEANTNLYSRIAQSLRDAGYASSDVAKVTETVATSLKLSGASTEEASSVITQLSQALGSGVLRGEEFNAIMENGGRLAKLLASGLGTSIGGLRNMATAGELTTDKLIPVLTNVDILRKEFEQLPQTVSGSAQKLENAFLSWVGGTNEATGATATLSAGLDGLAENIDTVATAAGILVTVGVAKYVGNWTTTLAGNTAEIIRNYKSQVSLSAAQLQAATMTQRKAVADADAATSAYNLALAEANVAKGSNASTLATKNLIARRTEMIAANAALVQSNRAVSASQEALNRVTSTTNLIKTGASSLLSLVGGIPGALMLGATAWYSVYQQQEQARQSAIQYADTIDQVKESLKTMSLTQVNANIGRSSLSLSAQNFDIESQKSRVAELSNLLYNAQQAAKSASEGTWLYNDANEKAATYAAQLADEEGKLEQMQSKRQKTQALIDDLTQQSISKTVEMSGAVSSLADMYDRLNKVTRQTTLFSPAGFPGMALPELSDKQQAAITRQQRNKLLNSLKGADKARQQATFEADDLALPSGWRERYVNDAVTSFNESESSKPAKKGPKSDAEKQEDVYKRLLKQQQEQIALAGQSTELAKVKYQISQGELSTITQVQKSELLRNAAALDQVKSQERFKALQEELLTPEEELLQKTRERIKLLKEAAPASQEYKDTMERISKASVTDAPKYSGVDASVGGASGELFKVADAQKELEKWHEKQLEMQKELLDEKEGYEEQYAKRVAEINETNASKLQDIQAGYTSASLSMFSDLAGQSAALLQGIGQEGSAAYKTLFIASKAAAIAQAIINTELAATKAMAEGGLILGIPAATAIRAVGYASVALIAGQTIAGMAHDGIDRVPETGTWLLQKGERVVTAQTSAKLDTTLEKVQQNKQAERSAQLGSFVFQNSFTGKPDDATLLAFDQRQRESEKRIQKILTAQVLTPSGEFGNALKTIYPNRRKT